MISKNKKETGERLLTLDPFQSTTEWALIVALILVVVVALVNIVVISV